ncbi:NAD(P)-dependent oxidoreductase [Nocardia farcinica]|uniref:NAD(P)-dependent oxidoreductase n=1 Tax=Nocardia farcinica TaxID=37329 RepID=UPI0037912B36
MTDTRPVAFLGLGAMGAPMSQRLLDAGITVTGFDPRESARATLVAAGGLAADTAAAAVAAGAVVILTLPDSTVVESTLADPAVRAAVRPGTTIIDMSSSDPVSTRRLAAEWAARAVTFLDAPVSGGVDGARTGTLTIMCGGPDAAVDAVAGLLGALGTPRRVGPIGAGHALKAVNNLLAGVHLLAAAEALAIVRRFGLDPDLILPVLNAASGRSAATEEKLPRFVVPETYDSGFALALMLKDMRIATALAATLGAAAALGDSAVDVWARAAADLGPGADQTEIARWIQNSGSVIRVRLT